MENQLDRKLEQNYLSRIGWSLALMLVLKEVLQYLILRLASPDLLFLIQTNSWVRYAVLLFPQYLIAMPMAVFLLRGNTVKLSTHELKAGQFFILFLITYFLMYAGNFAGKIVTMIISVLFKSRLSDAVSTLVIRSDIWANLFVVAILGPIVEELFFRKLLIGKLRRYGEHVAILTSALIFGLIHGNLSQAFYAFTIGLALGYIYVKTGKLIYTILIHMIINLMGGIIAPAVVTQGGTLMQLYGILILGIAIAGLALFIKRYNRIRFEAGPIELQNWKVVFLNPGMILFFVVCAAIFAISTYSSLR